MSVRYERKASTANRYLVLIPIFTFTWTTFSSCSSSHESGSEPHNGGIRIVASDYGYHSADSVLSGLSHVVFENRGSTIHEAMFIKLPDGMTGEDYLREVRGGSAFPQGALDYSGPGLTSPGEKVEIWLHLDPGNYILGCWFRGHLESIPAHTLTVHKRDSGDPRPPKEDAVLRMIDFRFELDGQLRKGSQVLRVETVGPSMHEVDIFRLNDGTTLADLKEWQESGKAGVAPAVAVGGVLDSHNISRVVWLKAYLRPGRHVLWCGMDMVPDDPGPAGDVTHADVGMFKEFLIGD